MGAAACYYLAEKGVKVLGLDQFSPPHTLGSHSGQTRIIRKAYFEHPDYVPLLEKAYQNWDHLEKITGKQVFHKAGLLYFGKPDGPLISGVSRSAELYQVKVEQLNPFDIKRKCPEFNIPEDFTALFEPDAGYLLADKSIELYLKLAIAKGAEILDHTKVLGWKPDGEGYAVTTSQQTYYADSLMFCAGAWSQKLVPELSDYLTVTRQLLAWMDVPDFAQFHQSHFPCWTLEAPGYQGIFYGFPVSEVSGQFGGLKLAWHNPGIKTDPDNMDNHEMSEDLSILLNFIKKYLPSVGTSLKSKQTCMYTNSPDGDFIIDFLPGHNNNVVLATGFSGHGFKFVSAMGEILAQMIINREIAPETNFLGLHRFGL